MLARKGRELRHMLQGKGHLNKDVKEVRKQHPRFCSVLGGLGGARRSFQWERTSKGEGHETGACSLCFRNSTEPNGAGKNE